MFRLSFVSMVLDREFLCFAVVTLRRNGGFEAEMRIASRVQVPVAVAACLVQKCGSELLVQCCLWDRFGFVRVEERRFDRCSNGNQPAA